jgi:hypothetical protein
MDDEETDRKQSPPPWGLSQQLMAKSLEVAFENPALAVRLANLAVRASIYLGEAIDPFAAQEVFHRNRWRKDEFAEPKPVPEKKPGRGGRSKVSS